MSAPDEGPRAPARITRPTSGTAHSSAYAIVAPAALTPGPRPLLLLDLAARPVIAHRGNRAHAPENTLEAFAQAVALGADAIELDVHLTADGHAVVMHDAKLDRTTSGAGPLAAITLAQLRSLDAGARFTRDGGRTHPYAGRGVRVPTLGEVLDAFPGVPTVIEVKTPRASEEVRRVILAHGAERRCVVDAFDMRALLPFRGSSIALGAGRDGVARLIARALTGRAAATLPYRALFVPTHYGRFALPLRRMAAVARPAGCTLHVWTVNDPAQAHALWALGACGMVTDDPARILKARGGAG